MMMKTKVKKNKIHSTAATAKSTQMYLVVKNFIHSIVYDYTPINGKF